MAKSNSMSEMIPFLSKKVAIKVRKMINNRKFRVFLFLFFLGVFSFHGLFKSQPIFLSDDFPSLKSSGKLDYSIEGMIQERADYNSNLKMSLRETQNHSQKERRISQIEMDLYQVVGEYPIKEMVSYIAKYDRDIAGLIVGIAKKESNWGKRVPLKDGKDCYNYWGYKGAGTLGTSMGYGCFASPKEGVEVIGRRIAQLASQDINTPGEMVVWKCGSTCAGHPPENVRKWVADVSIYFNKISKREV